MEKIRVDNQKRRFVRRFLVLPKNINNKWKWLSNQWWLEEGYFQYQILGNGNIDFYGERWDPIDWVISHPNKFVATTKNSRANTDYGWKSVNPYYCKSCSSDKKLRYVYTCLLMDCSWGRNVRVHKHVCDRCGTIEWLNLIG